MDSRWVWPCFPCSHGSGGFAYKVTDYYSPGGERTILWNDPDIAIQWPIDPSEAIVSDKDRAGALLKNAEIFP